MRDSIKGQ